MRLYVELLLIQIAGRKHMIAPNVWASFSSWEQDRLRRAADDAGVEIWVTPC